MVTVRGSWASQDFNQQKRPAIRPTWIVFFLHSTPTPPSRTVLTVHASLPCISPFSLAQYRYVFGSTPLLHKENEPFVDLSLIHI